jgi:HSP20 family molecular chaperone IbpA
MVRFETYPFSVLAGQGLNTLFRMAETVQDQMAQAAAEAASDPAADPATGSSPVRTAAPRAELSVEDDIAKLVMLIPGFGPEHLDIQVERASVTVKGEREDGPAGTQFERTFKLPFPVDAAETTADVELGVLTLKLPRLSADKPQRIEIRGKAAEDS